jgi:hypothetical protein
MRCVQHPGIYSARWVLAVGSCSRCGAPSVPAPSTPSARPVAGAVAVWMASTAATTRRQQTAGRHRAHFTDLLPLLEKAGGCHASVYRTFAGVAHTAARSDGNHWLK